MTAGTFAFAAQDSDAGARLDVFVSETADVSRSMAESLIADGRVQVNGVAKKKNYRLERGDRITVEIPEPTQIEAKPQQIPLDIVYEDEDIIVVNKARGMVVHPAAGNYDGTLVNALLAHCGGTLSGIGGKIRPGIVHRIDKDTSGLIVAAKNDRAHLSLAEQIKEHSAGRIYQAVIIGRMREPEGTIDAPIGRHPSDRKKMAVVANGKRAVTHYRTIAEYNGYTHIECRLETGRTHQIRVHFANAGHPLAGDRVYGSKNDKSGLDGQCLHASELRLRHPVSGAEMRFTCGLPRYFSDFLAKLARQK